MTTTGAEESGSHGPEHGHGHGHEHGQGASTSTGTEHEHEHEPGGGHGHGHAHGGLDPSILRSREAMRTLMLSLVVLGVTAAFQIVVVVASGSVALLADSVHNVGDALTAVPLAIAFILLRRPRTKRLTYGWGRAEDFAGLAVVLIILFSAVYAAYESIDRLINPARRAICSQPRSPARRVHRQRMGRRVPDPLGRRIGSAALVADGYHARIDGFTSLAVVVGVIGVALGFELADPIIGLLISLAIFRIVWQSIKAIGLRALDGVEEHVARRDPGRGAEWWNRSTR